MRFMTSLLLVLAGLGSAARAADLKMGDAAPALKVGDWVQGEPVKEFEKGKIYVVEFWATWCGPCRATIPHLTELSKKYTDVTFIGANVWEEDEAKVGPFVKEMGEKMSYRVAKDNKADEKKGAMAVTWMEAAGQEGIPTAFIVDKEGKVAWIGHPAGMDKPLEQVIAGTYDMKAEAARAAAEDALKKDIQEKVIRPLQKGQNDLAWQNIDELIKAHPDQSSQLLGMKVGVALQQRNLDRAYAALDEMTAQKDIKPEQLNEVAWAVLTEPVFAQKRDATRAGKWALAAAEGTNWKAAAVIDTLARSYAVQGNWDKATETLQKGIDVAKPNEKDDLMKTLELYKEKKLPKAQQEEK